MNLKEFQSRFYPITIAATTIRECQDTKKHDGSVIEGMSSFIHYSHNAIGKWLFTRAGGLKIDPENTGYKHILLHPHPGGGLTSAKTGFLSRQGEIKTDFKLRIANFSNKL